MIAQLRARLLGLRCLAPACLTLLIALAPGPAHAIESSEHTIVVNGVARDYRLFVPAKTEGKRAPAFLLLHGATSNPSQMERYSNFDELAEREGLVAVYPLGVGRHWNDGRKIGRESTADDITFLRTLILALDSQGLVDPKRVYVAGISNGGMMTLHMACMASDLIAGIGVVAAEIPVDAECPSPRPMPVILFHGTADKFVPFNGGAIHAGIRNHGSVHSNAETIAFWRKENGCGAAASHEIVSKTSPGGLRVVVQDFSCPPGRGLRNVIIEGGGHTWPGARQGLVVTMILGKVTDDIDANAMMWKFFQSQAAPGS